MPTRSRSRRSGSTTEVDGTNDTRLWHPWLRINRILRMMLYTRLERGGWAQVRVEFKRP
jgi:hypothetical protein